MAKAKTAAATQGAPVMYGSPMTERVGVRLNGAQAEALGAYCRREKTGLATFLRQAALEHAGLAKLAKTDVRRGLPEERRTEAYGSALVKLSAEQHRALAAHCRKAGVTVGPFIREAALKKIGKPELGAAGRLQALAAS